MASLAVVSCAQMENPVPTMELSDRQITFDVPIVEPATKAHDKVINGSTFPTTSTFNVAAVWTSGNFESWTGGTTFMPEWATAEYADDKGAGILPEGNANRNTSWATNPAYYWPKQGNLTFIAYSPAALAENSDPGTKTVTVTNSGIKFDNYSAFTNGNQPDILYTGFIANKTKAVLTDPAQTYDGVQIPFSHALTQVIFNLQTAENYSNVEIVVTSLKLNGINTVGSFEGGAWSSLSAEANFAVTDGTAIPVNSSTISSTSHANMRDVLIIPQPFGDIEIDIEFTMAQNGGEPIAQKYTKKVSQLTYYTDPDHKSTTTLAMDAFQIGKKYIYNITFALDQIFFSPEVTDWAPIYSDITPEA